MRIDVLEEFASLHERWYPFLPELGKKPQDYRLGFNTYDRAKGIPKAVAVRNWKKRNPDKVKDQRTRSRRKARDKRLREAREAGQVHQYQTSLLHLMGPRKEEGK